MRLIHPNIEFIYKIWGGNKLAALKNVPAQNSSGEKLGEVWEISSLKEAQTVETSLSYLFKLIDTCDYLSVQVHPTDEYALAKNLGKGKSECWVILDSQPGASLYLGFKPGVTKEMFFEGVKKSEDLSSMLVEYNVKPGDVFVVPAGAVHAIGPGILLAEVQQASGVTYRVWDWNRVDHVGKPRELHVKEAFDVLNFEPDFQKNLIQLHFKNLFSLEKTKIYQHRDFSFWFQKITSDEKISSKSSRAMTIFSIDSDIEVSLGTEKTLLKKGESLLALPGQEEIQLRPEQGEAKCLFIN